MNCIVHGVTEGWTQLSDFHFSSDNLQMSQNVVNVEKKKKNLIFHAATNLSIFKREGNITEFLKFEVT